MARHGHQYLVEFFRLGKILFHGISSLRKIQAGQDVKNMKPGRCGMSKLCFIQFTHCALPNLCLFEIQKNLSNRPGGGHAPLNHIARPVANAIQQFSAIVGLCVQL